jgi:hypothetical protein
MRMGKEIREIKIWVKGEFEDWRDAEKRIFHGYEITERENKELFEFVRQLLKKTHYSCFAITNIYKTVEHGYIIKLFRQTENDIIKNIRRC